MNQRVKNTLLRSGWFLMLLAGAYLLAAVVVFDLTEPSLPFDEENYQGRAVAFGPRPRVRFCAPTYHGLFFTGDEWPFKVFRPVCDVWRIAKGYAAPGGGEPVNRRIHGSQ